MTRKIYYYYPETFVEKFFRYLVKVLQYCVMLVALAGLLIVYQGDKEMKALAAELGVDTSTTNVYDVYGLEIQSIPEEEQVSNEIDNVIPKAEIPELEVIENKPEKILETEKVAEIQTVVKNKATEKEIMEVKTTVETKGGNNYNPTVEERLYAYKVAFAEAGIEDSMGQTLVINVAINNMRKNNFSSLIEEFEAEGRYDSVKNGQVYNSGKIVEVSNVPQGVKNAVDIAFEYDYSEEILKQQAESLGITDSKYWKGGATYFYNPDACSERQNSLRENIKVEFKYGHHIFYRYWDKQ